MKGVISVLFILTIIMTPIWAQTVPDASRNTAGVGNHDSAMQADPRPVLPASESQDISWQFPWMRMIGGLGIVLCLMAALYLVAKKYAPRFFPKSAADRNLKIIETLSMGDKRSIALIEFGNNRFLIGNTPHQINLLATLPESLSLVSEPDDPAAETNARPPKAAKSPFRSLFEVEKKRSTQYTGNAMPDDVRVKMRQLREALER